MTDESWLILQDKIHESNNTIVYKAYNKSQYYPVIVKVQKNEFQSQEKSLRFKREYEILKKFDNGNVPKVYDFQIIDGNLAIVMEDFDAKSLNLLSIYGKLQIIDFINLFLKITDIVINIHERRIIHKDINPSNILLNSKEGILKVSDFGIASQLTSENQEMISLEKLEGNLHYISPEQTGRTNRVLDYRSDFYSLGITFYQLLTGKLPFYSTDPVELIHFHLAKNPVPPNKHDTNIPRVLSNIIMKLMEKNAEDRYQSALGLQYDLKECISKAQHNQIENFTIGLKDYPYRLNISQKLYGREEESDLLINALSPVFDGDSKIISISGYSGIGKSSLINEAIKPITLRKGFFIKGKFEKYQKDSPYFALIQAFKSLVNNILTKNEQEINIWKNKLSTILKPNGKILVDIIPELELLSGQLPDVPGLSPEEETNRFTNIITNFISVFADKDHPLIMVLDDLQWADAASISLLETLFKGKKLPYFCVIIAFRDNEVDAHHALSLMIDQQKHNDKESLFEINLRPINKKDINTLVSETLIHYNKNISKFVDIVDQKTDGNPFFIYELLNSIFQSKYLYFDNDKEIWDWNLDKISALPTSNNVANIVLKKIFTFEEKTRKILKIASCIGYKFCLGMLTGIYNGSVSDIIKGIKEALISGYIIPLSESYQLLESGEEDDILKEHTSELEFKFAHDRIYHTTYQMLDEEERVECHYKIGLRAIEELKKSENAIFEVVKHLNIAQVRISDNQQKEQLSNYNYMAGKKAKKSSAYKPALDYFRKSCSLLGSHYWEKNYSLMHEINLETAELEYLNSNYKKADKMFDEILARSKSIDDQIKVLNVKILLYASTGKIEESLKLGIHSLELLGEKISLRPSVMSLLLELIKIRRNLKNKNIPDLINLPLMQDKKQIQIMQIYTSMSSASYFYESNLLGLMCLKMVNNSLTAGNYLSSGFAYASYGFVLCFQFKKYKRGFEFGKLGTKLNSKYDYIQHEAKTHMMTGGFINHYSRHLKESEIIIKKGISSGFENGDIIFAGYNISAYASAIFILSRELPIVIDSLNDYLSKMQRSHTQDVITSVYIIRQGALCLSGLTKNAGSLDCEEFNSMEMEQKCIDNEHNISLCYFYFVKSITAYLFKDYNNALNAAMKFDRIIFSILKSGFLIPEHHFYYSLILLAVYQYLDRDKKYLKKVKKFVKKLEMWSDGCRENYYHKYLIVSAELAKIENNFYEAEQLFKKGIESARENSFFNNQAIGCELLGRLYLERKYFKSARKYINIAKKLFFQWGAVSKLKELDIEYKNIFTEEELDFDISTDITSTDITISGISNTSSNLSSADSIDLYSIIKAYQILSGEIKIEKLMEKVIQIINENAGANTCYLILPQDSGWFIKAQTDINKNVIDVLQSIPVLNEAKGEAKNLLCEEVLRFVINSKKSIVLNDALNKGDFVNNPYIASNSVKSILCIPLINKGELIGIIYLENKISKDTFTEKKQKILDLISTQMAISLENARIHENLDQLIKERTEKLNNLNIQLIDEIKSRKQTEIELKEALIKAQNADKLKSAFLATMSHEIRTPLNPIIGLVDVILLKKELPDQIKEYAKVIKSSGKHLLYLINDILDISKIEAGALTLEKTSCSVQDLFDMVYENAKALLKQNDKNLEIKKYIDDKVNPFIITDITRLTQVLNNLVSNAVKFTHKGSIEMGVSLSDNSTMLDFYVKDTGIGIAEDKKEAIFNPFQQADTSTTREYGGTGLGLAIVRKIINLMEGSISLTTEPDKGTTFYFSIPYITTTEVSASEQRSKFLISNRQKTVKEKYNVLVVDDHIVSQKMIKSLLNEYQYNVSLADNGIKAVEIVKENKDLDLIIMDIQMPKMDGIEAIKQIRAFEKENNLSRKPIIIVSAAVSENSSDYIGDRGADYFLPKPIQTEKLMEIIDKYISIDE